MCHPTGAFVRVLLSILAGSGPATGGELVGKVLDAEDGRPLPARVYVRSESGEWLFVESQSTEGSALPYREQWVPMPTSVEKHTTISAHPFRVQLKPGRYEITVERGKEYFPVTRTVVTGEGPRREIFRLPRWVDMARRGWYSGETHVHRRIHELPNVLLAEDLNVAFPVTFWTTAAYAKPTTAPSRLRRQGPSPFGPREDRGREMIPVDPTHVIFPRNTEYEIFSVAGKPHVLGALFILNHKTVFDRGMPPAGAIAANAHREGAILDLDKHNWPWSMMLVPVANVDLYELANNSIWRTEFGFRSSTTQPAEYMDIETDSRGITERGWLDFGFENYYTLLNCGFRLQPSAGTASGVHPVPLGYSRVYVHLDREFSGANWIAGLKEGRSFVTTGPMLFAKIDGRHPGYVFEQAEERPIEYRVQGEALSARPISGIEVIRNGRRWRTLRADNKKTESGAYSSCFDVSISIHESSWICLRSFEPGPGRRVRFAHTAPWHIHVAGKPVRPRKEEVAFLIRRVNDEITRNTGILPEAALLEYQEALEVYRRIAERAR